MRLYRALLALYPKSFRAEYGGEMGAVFEQRLREGGGPGGRALVWLGGLGDVLVNAAAVHWDLARQDLRYTSRALARTPGFAVTAVLVIALGVGANTAAFSVADFVLVRPLPYQEPDRLVMLWERVPQYNQLELSPANYRDWKAGSTGFENMGAYLAVESNLVDDGEPDRVLGAAVTSEILPMLGVTPALGRLFTAADDREDAPGTVLLSHGLWQSRFGGDAGVLGRRLLLDGVPFVVIGVLPRGFHFPNRDVALWRPMPFGASDFEDRDNNYLNVLARLGPGVSLEQARAELAVVAGRLEREYPVENEHTGATLLPLRDNLPERSRLLLLALCGAALCILLIACANLANLLLARTLARQKELALRTALGAGRERLVRQLLTESLVLAALGGGLGLLVAAAALPLLGRLVPGTLPIGPTPSLDLRVLLFAGLVTGVTAVGFGVLPAVRAARDSGLEGLREGARAGSRRQQLRSSLVVVEVMASVALLVSSGLLLRALWRIQSVDPGFRSEGVLTLRTALPWPKYAPTARRMEFYHRVLTEVQAIPGVERAAYISFLPMAMGGGIWPVAVNGERTTRQGNHTASLRFITPDFFRTLEIPLRAGRGVTESDRSEGPAVAVVSESFVRRYWPDSDPLGRRFDFALQTRTIVGVVGDIMVRGLERTSEPQVYLPAAQVPDSSLIFYAPKDLVVRSSAEPVTLVAAIRDIVRRIDPEQPISGVRPLAEILEEETASRAVQVRLLGSLAGLALLLAGIGIHGLLSYTVSNRERELGVRIALGARRRDILALVLGQGVRLAGSGVVLGVGLAYAAARGMTALLASVGPADGATLVAVGGLCITMAAAGCFFPALRAVRTDPIAAIRAE
ncbi:MAG TPA: ABC transporter permease [Gemmatimonadales bacterium]|jgi:putative ABC transport system permease protein|nr:ABC transporter permease [Gemmatimonadales bacterium]